MTDSTPRLDQESTQNIKPEAHTKNKKHRPLPVRILKWIGVTILSVIALIVLALTVTVWILTPERLTPLVNKYASEYLIADVEARRVELTFWSTFPHFSVQVDSLQMVSRSLRDLPDSTRRALPADADSLLFMRRFAGGINLAKLMRGDIALYDVGFSDIRANLIQVDSLLANYLIIPPSEPEPEKETEIPNISINRFTIADGLAVRYRSPADSLDASMMLARLLLADSTSTDKPRYTLSLNGDAKAAVHPLVIPTTPFSIDGRIAWDSKKPMQTELTDFRVAVDKVTARFDTGLDFSDSLRVTSLSAAMPDVKLTDAIALLPEEYRKPLEGLDTDLAISLTAKLLEPYTVGSKRLPVAEGSFKASADKVIYDRLNLSALDIDVAARVDCNDLDATTIRLNNIAATGRAIDFDLKGSVSNPMTDPLINATFNGAVTFQQLPSALLSKLPCVIRGMLQGNAEIDTRLSYLSPKQFHRAKINGSLTLTDFRMAMTDGSMDAFLHKADFKLGTSSDLTVRDHHIDSMLTASLKIDTIAVSAPGVSLAGSTLSAGVGARNISTSADTSLINPIGASIKAHRLTLRSDSDSIRLRLRDTKIAGSLQRYNGNSRAPLVRALIESARMGYGDKFNRAALRDARLTLELHPKARPEMSARRKARFDSIAAAHPELSSDSIVRMMNARFKERIAAYDKEREGREDIQVELDNSIVTMLRRWNAHGQLTTKRARLFTPYFPSRNTISDLQLKFSTDSVLLTDTHLRMNRSDFTLNGSVRNLRRALLSRHGSPYEVNFSVKSDTIDINDLTATMLRGAVFADRISAGTMQLIKDSDSGDDSVIDSLQRELDSEIPDTARAAVLIPSNINARFSMKAKHVRYADLWLDGLDGLVEMYDGALNLDRLRAYTSVGAVNFSALYSAPTADNLSVAAAVSLRRLNLRSVLDMMPEIDSLLPLLGEVRGIVDADLALTTRLDPLMNINIPTLNMALKISGDSLQLLDNETFRKIAKWMLFKHKDRNMIDRMDVELAIHDGYIDIYPFIFDMDRYRIGVRGSNDAALNLDYHVAVIKSPVPFKFGINIKGTPEKMKIRLGKARVSEKMVAESRQITDTVRVNLMKEITQVFRRGVRATGSRGLQLQDSRRAGSGATADSSEPEPADTFSHADSVTLIREGLIERPAGFIMPEDSIAAAQATAGKKQSKKKK